MSHHINLSVLENVRTIEIVKTAAGFHELLNDLDKMYIKNNVRCLLI